MISRAQPLERRTKMILVSYFDTDLGRNVAGFVEATKEGLKYRVPRDTFSNLRQREVNRVKRSS
jgi:hypothetical protein